MADLDQERADLNNLIRTAHEAIKDMTAIERRLDEKIAAANQIADDMVSVMKNLENAVTVMVRDGVQAQLEEATAANIDAYNEAWLDSIDKATQAIYRRFDQIFAATVGKTVAERYTKSLSDEITGGA